MWLAYSSETVSQQEPTLIGLSRVEPNKVLDALKEMVLRHLHNDLALYLKEFYNFALLSCA